MLGFRMVPSVYTPSCCQVSKAGRCWSLLQWLVKITAGIRNLRVRILR